MRLHPNSGESLGLGQRGRMRLHPKSGESQMRQLQPNSGESLSLGRRGGLDAGGDDSCRSERRPNAALSRPGRCPGGAILGWRCRDPVASGGLAGRSSLWAFGYAGAASGGT
jgi:hypothetical protein